MEVQAQISENVKKSPNLGGKRPGSGRKKGGMNLLTKKKMIAAQLMQERILNRLNPVLNSQFYLAEGLVYVYRIDETGQGSKKRKEHVLVTDPEEIRRSLDDIDGTSGESNGSYYYVTARPPDNKAIDSLLDRVFGKARQNVGLDGGEDETGKSKPIKTTTVLSTTQLDKILEAHATKRASKNSSG